MLISQKSYSDCVHCCLSMMLCLDYETVSYGLRDKYTPETGTTCDEDLLTIFGYRRSRLPGTRSYRYFSSECGPFPNTTLPLFLTGREALITYKLDFHKDREGHMIYWTGNEILDPGLAKLDPKLHDIDFLSIYLMSRFHRPVGIC